MQRYEIRFSVTEELYNKLETAKAELSNALGKELSLEALLEKLLDKRKVKSRTGKNSSNSRYIPKSVKRAVLERDQHCCTFKAPDGTRCCAKHYLHFDHIVPFACGGKTEFSNLRLMCSTHNKLLAENYFGKAKVSSYSAKI